MASSDPPPRPGPKPRFTREEVFDAALRVLDADDGPLTMRRVADELGVATMTLYGYVGGRAELVEAVTALALQRAGGEAGQDVTWDERLRAEMRGLRDVARAHPQLVALALEQRSALPGLFRMRERTLDALLLAGFDEVTAVRALGVLTAYALGFSGAQARVAPIDLPEHLGALPQHEFPRLTAAAAAYPEHLSDEAFELGLTLLVDGLRALRPAGRARRPGPRSRRG